jgi:ribosomal protein L37E
MKSKRPHDYEQNVARFHLALEQHGDNPAAHAALAQIHWQAEELEAAIHHWRMAISASPHAPMAAGWKSQLKRALEMQERRAQGLSGSAFDDFKVCHRCHADIPVQERTCSNCGRAVEMTFFEWLAKKENIEDVARTAAPLVLVMSIVVLVVARLPLEYKACLAMATVIVGAWYFLRGLGGTIVD